MKRFYTRYSLLIALLIGLNTQVAHAQFGCDTINMPANITVCSGKSITLNPTVTGPYPVVSYFWSPSTYLSDPTIANPTVTATYTRNYSLQILAQRGSNLITNGNFEGGNTGFTSDYTLETSGPTTPEHYAITTDPSTISSSFPTMVDHTLGTGTGKMMLVDGANDSTKTFWCQNVAVSPFTQYQITIWMAPLSTPAAKVGLMIDGVTQTYFLVDGSLGVWAEYTYTFFNSSSASVDLCFYDEDTASSGNDVAVDDISMYRLCSSIASVNIVVPKFNPVISMVNPPCSKQVTVSGSDTSNAAIISRSWQFGDGSAADTGNGVSHNYSSAGNYKIVLTEIDSNGCVDSSTFNNITINTTSNHIQATGDTTICIGIPAQLSATGGNSYSWTPAAGLSDSSIADPTATPTASTRYIVTGVDSNGCTGMDTVYVLVYPGPSLNILPVTDPVTCSKSSVQLFVSGARKYIWQPGLLCDSNTSSHPIVTPETTTTFYVTGSDGKGCASKDSVTVYCLKDSAYIPNAFTPDGDGLNDVIYPKSYCLFQFQNFSVYNRWGQLMFSTDKRDDGWDGKFNGQPQPEGVYIYMIKGYKIVEGRVQKWPTIIKGNITLLR